MSDITPELNNIDRSIRTDLVKNITTQLIECKMKNIGRLLHGEVNKHLDDTQLVCPAISRIVINRAMQLHWSSLYSEDDECNLVSNENQNENESESYDDSRQKGGRPVGCSIASEYETELRRIKVYNNISMKYAFENDLSLVVKYYLEVVQKKSQTMQLLSMVQNLLMLVIVRLVVGKLDPIM